MPYTVTMGDDDQPAAGATDSLEEAIAFAEGMSRRLLETGGRQDGGEVKVWELGNDPLFGPQLLGEPLALFRGGLRVE